MEDLLTHGSPKRLVRMKGRWTLETEAYVRFARNHYRLDRKAIRGTDQIQQALENTELAEAAEALIADVDEDRCFDAVGARWVESQEDKETWLAGRAPNGESRRAKVGDVARALADIGRIDGEIAKLKRQLGELSRIIKQARGTNGVSTAAPTQTEGSPRGAGDSESTSASDSSGTPSPRGAPAADPKDEPSGEASLPREAAGATGEEQTPEEGASSDAEPERAANVPPPEAPLPDPAYTMPPEHKVAQLLKELVDDPDVAEACDGGPTWSAPLFASLLLNDDDAVIGAMVADLRSVVYIGGALLMVPVEARESMIEDGAPSEDVLESMSEVFNTVSAAINNCAGNPHVRTRPLARVTDDVPDWYGRPPERLDFRDASGGHFTLIAAPAPS